MLVRTIDWSASFAGSPTIEVNPVLSFHPSTPQPEPDLAGDPSRLEDKIWSGEAMTLNKRNAIDWRSWLALVWAVWFGLLYSRMVLEERAPGALRAIERVAEPIRTWCR
jgi:hypothetical protein